MSVLSHRQSPETILEGDFGMAYPRTFNDRDHCMQVVSGKNRGWVDGFEVLLSGDGMVLVFGDYLVR